MCLNAPKFAAHSFQGKGLRRHVGSAAIAVFLWAGAADATESAAHYLRGSIGFDLSSDADFRDVNCDSRGFRPLYGCGRGPAGRPGGSYGSLGTASDRL
ncbi:MAG: hypothetical protein OXF74_10425 [Rhodobacteraceae bacterium]|nr:hypothetical protein [Paracoccaceae bacterium]